MKQFTTFVTLILFAFIVAGCAPSLSGDVYSRDKVQKVHTVVEGEVIMVREVLIEGTKSGFGAIAGGIMGYALGSAVGREFRVGDEVKVLKASWRGSSCNPVDPVRLAMRKLWFYKFKKRGIADCLKMSCLFRYRPLHNNGKEYDA